MARCGLCFWSEGLRVASKILLYPAGPSAATPPSTGFSRSRLSGSPRRERGSDAGWGQWENGGFPGGLCEAGSEPDCVCPTGFALQIQCYQCEEFQLNNDCSSPEFIVNCTVNVQDMCQKEVMEQSAGKRLAALLLPSSLRLGGSEGPLHYRRRLTWILCTHWFIADLLLQCWEDEFQVTLISLELITRASPQGTGRGMCI